MYFLLEIIIFIFDKYALYLNQVCTCTLRLDSKRVVHLSVLNAFTNTACINTCFHNCLNRIILL